MLIESLVITGMVVKMLLWTNQIIKQVAMFCSYERFEKKSWGLTKVTKYFKELVMLVFGWLCSLGSKYIIIKLKIWLLTIVYKYGANIGSY
jgi:hypothetical protein